MQNAKTTKVVRDRNRNVRKRAFRVLGYPCLLPKMDLAYERMAP